MSYKIMPTLPTYRVWGRAGELRAGRWSAHYLCQPEPLGGGCDHGGLRGLSGAAAPGRPALLHRHRRRGRGLGRQRPGALPAGGRGDGGALPPRLRQRRPLRGRLPGHPLSAQRRPHRRRGLRPDPGERRAHRVHAGRRAMNPQAVNPQRGEVALSLDGRDLALAPSFALIAELEERLGPLPALLRRLAGPEWRARELSELLRLALAHTPGAPAPERREGLLLAAGLARLRPVAAELLLNALEGSEALLGQESPGEMPGELPGELARASGGSG